MLCWLWLAALFRAQPAQPGHSAFAPSHIPPSRPHPLGEQEELKAYMASRGKKVGEGEKLDAKAINKVRQISSPF